MTKKYLLFDIGGTNTRLAAYTKGSRSFGKPVIFKTPKKFSDGMKKITEEAHKLCGNKIKMVVGGIAGTVDKKKGTVRNRLRLPGWTGKPFAKTLTKNLGAKVIMHNDTAIVGLGEAVYGAGKGYDLVVYMTISTGVGGARIDHGQIETSYGGFEPGKQVIDEKGRSLEWHISGTSIKKRFGKNPHDLKNKKFWDTAYKYLATGLFNTIVYWSPEVLILGGGVLKNEMSLAKIKKELKLHKEIPKLPEIKLGKFDDFGGLYGAMALIKQGKNK
jgi:predicted NBD/HSP70 family sugar kinase